MLHQKRGLGWAIAQSTMVIGLAIGSVDGAVAQIVPDGTVGSRVVSGTANGRAADRIEGGAQQGQNLFHSFREFNVGTGQQVYFANPVNIRNIFSRVTGTNVSNIDGVLGVIGSANLFLMNPNGIVFGQNARLDVSGSFVGTTANAIGFGNQGWFSATNPENILPLLTVQPSAFLFNQMATGNILVNSQTATGLQVSSGQNLLLLGNNVNVDGSQLNAYGGRVEIGAVAGAGTIGLNADNSFSFPADTPRGNVSFTNGSRVDVTLDKGGDIGITAANIDVLSGSTLLAGISSGLGAAGSQAGNLTLNASENIQLGQASLLGNDVAPDAIGNGGVLTLTAGSLSVAGGSQLSARTLGQGNAGYIVIHARDRVSLEGIGEAIGADRNVPSAALSTVDQGGVGQGGDIEITTGSLSLTHGAQLASGIRGQGNAGSIVIHARDRVSLDGNSAILGTTETGGVGQGGDIEITTGSLSLTHGAQLLSVVRGQGNAGSIVIHARDRVSLDGISANSKFLSAALSTVEQGGVGQGGNIEITTGSLSLTHGAQLATATRGQGNAGNILIRARDRVLLNDGAASSSVALGGIGQGGNIEITTGSLSLTHGAQLNSGTRGQGNAGNVTAHVSRSVLLAGFNPTTGRSSLISSANLSTSVGTGGRIQITAPALTLADGAVIDARTNTARSGGDIIFNTDSLNLLNGGQVVTTTFSTGRAGNIIIPNADRILFSGHDSTFIQRQTQFSNAIANVGKGESGLFANTDRTSTGQAGNINITTQELNVRDNARITLNSQGTGLAGNLNITANSISLDHTRLTAETVSSRGGNIRLDGHTLQLNNGSISAATRSGQGGDLSINANSVDLTHSNMAVAATDRGGQAGNLTIRANDVQLNQSRLTAETRSTGRTAGANIILQDIDRFLYLQNGSQISAQAFNRAHGGNVTINADQGFVVARTGDNQNNDIIANADQGNGGEVSITAQGILGLEQRRSVPANITNDIDISSDQGLQGSITLNVPNTDPSQGLTELPTVPIDATNRLALTCPNTQSADRLSNFTVSGRGGLPPTPYEPLSNTDILDDVRLPNQGSSPASQTPRAFDRAIVEANGWIFKDNGKVTLIATEPDTKSQGFCHLR